MMESCESLPEKPNLQENPEALEQAVRNFVKGKYELDAQLAKGLMPKYCNTIPSICPRTFVEAALPYSDIVHGTKDDTVEFVDPFIVVGGTYKDYSEDKETVSAKIEKLHGMIGNVAQYCKMGDLPLYVACEGKNRVLMYQSLNQPIKAMVTHWPYPKPRELVLHLTKPSNIYVLKCLNLAHKDQFENRPVKLSILPYPELMVPILKAYGVNQGTNLYSLTTRKRLKAKQGRIISSLMS